MHGRLGKSDRQKFRYIHQKYAGYNQEREALPDGGKLPESARQAVKQARALRCEAMYLPHGIDVRVLERDDLIRTALCRSAPEVEQVSAEWGAKLALVGWQVSPVR